MIVFKTYQEIEDYLKDDRIKCLECGKYYKMLGNHLIAKHDTTADEYRDKYGIPHSHALFGAASLQRMTDQANERLKDESFKKKVTEVLLVVRPKKNTWVKTRKFAPAELNRLSEIRLSMTKSKFLKILENLRISQSSPKEFLQNIGYSRQWFTKMTKRFGLQAEVKEIYDSLPFQLLHVEKKRIRNKNLIKQVLKTNKKYSQRETAKILGVSYQTVHRIVNNKKR